MSIRLLVAAAATVFLVSAGVATAVTRDPVADAVAVRPATNTPAFPVTPSCTKAAQTEVVVVSSGGGTMVPTTPLVGRLGLEIQNRGPNSIFCKPTSGAAVNTTREIKNGEAWPVDATDAVTWNCKAATADQVSGAATIVTECGR